ncbi:ROK family protein [Mangrovivirga cuniculi]|uniref:ROK family transcriptional regulator n=1 Tax=Mangrovivirga cuniculi TaxID=2715131 RepID=A0A4D7JPQ4_9BACT|nr:ROK family protein [Mangrovivirga cuniculi]QCK16753.1 ROK family transcriptional regulator [Mangrovivirga cuniculi]
MKKQMIAHFANEGNTTIPELCNITKLSAPKVSSLLSELISEGIVKDYGKMDSTGGRRPNVYGLAPESGFFIGIDVKKYHINIGLTDFQKNIIKIEERHPYILKNEKGSLQELVEIINEFIAGLTIQKDKILGIGINLSGRINYATGYSYSFFNFQEEPLSKIIESEVGIRVFLDNDSRAMAFGEYSAGVVNDEKNILFINLDYGLGMGMIIDGQLYYGKSGYSGEFGHIPFFDNEVICNCGKKGCLETEASGWAALKKLKSKLDEGSNSLITKKGKHIDEITVEDIVDAANNDDTLAIELIEGIGENIGKGVAMLINIFNPELVILGGVFAETREYIQLPIRSAVQKYSLSLMNNDTTFKLSKLGNQAGVVGACLLVRNRLLALDQ